MAENNKNCKIADKKKIYFRCTEYCPYRTIPLTNKKKFCAYQKDQQLKFFV